MSSFGQGSLGLSQKNAPVGGGAPFPAGSAANGLSVDPGTGQIVLGNDTGGALATLLSNREIPMAGFTVGFVDGVKQSVLYPAGIGTHLFTTDDYDGQLLVLNGHNSSAGVNAFMSMALFADNNQAMQVIQTNSNYAFPGGFPSNAGAIYAAGSTPKMYFLTDALGQIIFCPGGLTAADNTVTFFPSGNVRMGAGVTDPNVNLQLDGQLATGDPGFTGGVSKWELGSVVAGASVLDATRFVQVALNGVILKLALAV